MLSSLLKIEQFLKCEVCDCILEKVQQDQKCPTCELPATTEDLLTDPMHDNLVSYVYKLKFALLNHSLTPLEDSLAQRGNKRSDIDTQESTEDLEAEYSDLPDRKKFKKSDSFLDDLLSERPIRSSAPPPNYVAPTEDDEDIMEIDTLSEPITESRSSETSDETWKCTKCEFENLSCLQACGVCKKFKNRNIPVVEPTHSTRSKTRTGSCSSSVPNTLEDRSLETATLPSRTTTRKKQQQQQQPETNEIHIMFTGVLDAEMELIEKHIERVAESRLKFTVGSELKDMEEVTHVISSVDSGKKCHRTLKYLSGILRGKWIVTPKWLLDSMKKKRWLPEESYEIQGDAKSGLTRAPSKGRKIRLSHKETLFEGMRFYLAGDYSEKHNKKDLGYLIDSGGGIVEKRRPISLSDVPKTLDKSLPVVIYGTQTNMKKNAWLNQYQIRSATWIIESISQLRIE
ncbi:hypothetical protein EDC94DRAFT_510366 [Helicostylum pulchrum]|nr:hypothetical protein EDC94DRAFT_510366 [Helicostylum pulchrum]